MSSVACHIWYPGVVNVRTISNRKAMEKVPSEMTLVFAVHFDAAGVLFTLDL